MSIAGILITAYLAIGGLVFGLIWVILIASKRRAKKSPEEKRERSKSQPLGEPTTKSSRFQS